MTNKEECFNEFSNKVRKILKDDDISTMDALFHLFSFTSILDSYLPQAERDLIVNTKELHYCFVDGLKLYMKIKEALIMVVHDNYDLLLKDFINGVENGEL